MRERSWRHWLATVGLLLALTVAPAPPATAWQTVPLADDASAGGLLTLIEREELTRPLPGGRAAWIVTREPGWAPAPLASAPGVAYTLPRRELPNMHGEHGASQLVAEPPQRLAPGAAIPLDARGLETFLTVRLQLGVADAAPGAITSAPFTLPSGEWPRLELWEGRLAAGEEVRIEARGTPVVLLGGAQRLAMTHGNDAVTALSWGDVILLAEETTLRNAGARPATFAVAWLVSDAAGTPRAVVATGTAPELAAAWQRNGCHLNPGTPACLTVTLAAACASNAATPGCDADSDADACLDVAEVRSGLDPFSPADCVSSRDGEPALNCLFLESVEPCDGATSAGSTCWPVSRRGPSLGVADPCQAPAEAPQDACLGINRDPACDGFGLPAR